MSERLTNLSFRIRSRLEHGEYVKGTNMIGVPESTLAGWVDDARELQVNTENSHAEMTDSVNHPDHYTPGKIECIDYIFSLGIGKEFCMGNVVKLIHRWRAKGGLEDLQKAQFYLNRLIEEVADDQGTT